MKDGLKTNVSSSEKISNDIVSGFDSRLGHENT